MDSRKLPSNSESLLLKLVDSENPTQALQTQYNGISEKQKQELDSVVRELKGLGYIDVKWADNEPCFVVLNNSARTYSERLAENNAHKTIHVAQEEKMRNKIFISHRSTDKSIADMLVDFFVGTGIPKETIFCSSLPGNDVNEHISGEVKSALKNSAVNIAILSKEYYKSAYCLNEAGVLWYENEGAPVILIALPEINTGNMYGFLNNEYVFRRLDSDTDISHIYDIVSERISASQTKFSLITSENNKLKKKYVEYLTTRTLPLSDTDASTTDIASEITTDDERIVLYYILHKNVRKVSKYTALEWLSDCEICGVNVDNAFDLLSSWGKGAVIDNTLEFDVNTFRKYSANAAKILPSLKKCVEQHTKLSSDTFKKIWGGVELDAKINLFLAYVVDEQVCSFGSRWKEGEQVKQIEQWESKNKLDNALSSNYKSCLDFFIQNELLYENSWTTYGNPREYVLRPSLRELLFNCPREVMEKLQIVKDAHHLISPH